MPSGCVALLVTLGIGPVLEETAEADALMDESESESESETEGPALGFATMLPLDADGIPLVRTLDDVYLASPPVEIPARPKMIRHRVRPRERVAQIAVRYGVRPEDLWRWNEDLDPQQAYPKGHKHLRVRAKRLPPPRFRARYVAQPGEGWMDIAVKFHVETRDLYAYNWNRRSIEAGDVMNLWVDPGWPRTIHPGEGPPVPESFEVTAGGRSVGRPDRGRLEGGVLLPESPLYTRKVPSSGLWGSSHTIEQIQRAFAIFRHDTGFEGEVIIGAISREHGRRFVPHRSHQSGRDIDIRMPLWPGVSSLGTPTSDEIDWYATWGLVKAFIETGEVAVIFLDVSRHRQLYEAARAMGETPESLEPVIKWPRWKGRSRPVIRHSPGHDTHIHVRIDCGPDEPRCRER